MIQNLFISEPKVVIESKENKEFRETASAPSTSNEQVVLIQPNPPWGLARLSSRTTGTTYYTYDSSAGEGTCLYLVDSGIQASHQDFGNRATFLADVTPETDNPAGDAVGHGTHTSGIAGGTVYGVAKRTRIFMIRFCGTRGCYTSTIPAGVQAAIDHYLANRGGLCRKGGVINMSLGVSNYGWEESTGADNPEFVAVNAAVEDAYNAG